MLAEAVTSNARYSKECCKMKTIRTNQLKPNPAGKDRTRSGASETQLAAEWVDIMNTGRIDADLNGVALADWLAHNDLGELFVP